jgi:ATP-dependent RNA helicase DDX1
LAEIEEHLGCTIQQIETDMKVPTNEFDGKVVYGQKRANTGSGYQDHVKQLVPIVVELSDLEASAQSIFIRRLLLKK